jgi:zinc transporter, ZIP family
VKAVLVAVALVLVAAAFVVGLLRPWARSGKAAGELAVEHSTLTSGRIALVLVNRSEDRASVAQVMLNDAFVDFHASQANLDPGDAERIVIHYPWIRGEAYDIELMISTGRTVGYEIEEAA